MRYTTILHQARINLNLSLNDYCIADCIYHLSNNPNNKAFGWCYASKQRIADDLGLSKVWVIKSIKSLEEKGIVEKSDDGRLIKTTKKWYFEVISKLTNGKESLPKSVNDVNQDRLTELTLYKDIDIDKNKNSSESNDSDVSNAELNIKNKGKRGLEFYSEFVELWCGQYPILGFDKVSGAKIKELIKKTVNYLKVGGKPIDSEHVVGMFAYVLNYLKTTNHWCHGKDINTFETKYLSIVNEIKNGKSGTAKKTNTRDIIDSL